MYLKFQSSDGYILNSFLTNDDLNSYDDGFHKVLDANLAKVKEEKFAVRVKEGLDYRAKVNFFKRFFY